VIGRRLNGVNVLDSGFVPPPPLGLMHYREAFVKLIHGDLLRGFRDYEYRWEHEHFQAHARVYEQPQWTGQSLEGKTILVWHEQGYGDSIMMHRYMPLLERAAKTVHLEIPPALVSLFEANMAEQKHQPGRCDEFDYHCPIMSLPHGFGTQIDTIPAPRMVAPRQHRRRWQLGRGRPNVGVVWSGDQRNANNSDRSVPLAEFHTILAGRNVEPWCISHEVTVGDSEMMRRIQMPVIPYADFGELAGVIEQLDLVITIDTAVAHLAASLGKQTWVLVCAQPHWIYVLGRDHTCPWYPSSMRLFRQQNLGDWSDVLGRAGAALKLWETTAC
jgi:hypothetical protein